MNAVGKALIPNKEWIIKEDETKIGALSKVKKGYAIYRKGKKFEFKSLEEIKQELNLSLLEDTKNDLLQNDENVIYGFPCSSKPYEPIYNVRKKLPLFAKSSKSKSQYCAGYYVIKFHKGWVKSFCPKLITLERYPYYGPYKTEQEMRTILNVVNKL